MERVIGLGLSAGRGIRFRPLTLKAKGYLRAKAAVRFLGYRVLDWLVEMIRRQGIEDFIMVTKGKENRYQIKSIAGYGERMGVRVRYSHVRYDRENTGSADAVLTNLDHFDITDPVFVFPTDSLLEMDLAAMLETHRRTGAAVTIAAARQPAETIAHRYGLINRDEHGQVLSFIEKPSMTEICALYGVTMSERAQLPPLVTNAGFYLMDSNVLRAASTHADIEEMRRVQFDIGGDLLPWLVEHGYPVYTHEVGLMGDLGNIPSYLHTMVDALHGRFTSINGIFASISPGRNELLIDPESLALTDPVSHLTLAEKIERGLVCLEPPLRIGKYVQISPGVTLSECNIDDDCDIAEHATIRRSSIGAGSLIGPYSHIEDTLTGIMVELQSTREHPTSLSNYVAIGDEVIIRDGVTLSDGVTIHPRLKVPAGANIPPNTEVESPEQMLEYL